MNKIPRTRKYDSLRRIRLMMVSGYLKHFVGTPYHDTFVVDLEEALKSAHEGVCKNLQEAGKSPRPDKEYELFDELLYKAQTLADKGEIVAYLKANFVSRFRIVEELKNLALAVDMRGRRYVDIEDISRRLGLEI